jgi:hypothetical protein
MGGRRWTVDEGKRTNEARAGCNAVTSSRVSAFLRLLTVTTAPRFIALPHSLGRCSLPCNPQPQCIGSSHPAGPGDAAPRSGVPAQVRMYVISRSQLAHRRARRSRRPLDDSSFHSLTLVPAIPYPSVGWGSCRPAREHGISRRRVALTPSRPRLKVARRLDFGHLAAHMNNEWQPEGSLIVMGEKVESAIACAIHRRKVC